MSAKKILTLEEELACFKELAEKVAYNSKAGKAVWVSGVAARFMGRVIGSPTRHGHWIVYVTGARKRVVKQRFLWWLKTQEQPYRVSFKNHDPSDFRFSNLYSRTEEECHPVREKKGRRLGDTGERFISVYRDGYMVKIPLNGKPVYVGVEKHIEHALALRTKFMAEHGLTGKYAL